MAKLIHRTTILHHKNCYFAIKFQIWLSLHSKYVFQSFNSRFDFPYIQICFPLHKISDLIFPTFKYIFFALNSKSNILYFTSQNMFSLRLNFRSDFIFFILKLYFQSLNFRSNFFYNSNKFSTLKYRYDFSSFK